MDLKNIKGIGSVTEKYLNKLNIFDTNDLISYYPKDYELFDEPKLLNQITINKIESVKVKIVSKISIFKKNKLTISSCYISDGSKKIKAVWFNIPYIDKYILYDNEYILRGKIVLNKKTIVINQPKIYKIDDYEKIKNSLSPIYSLTKGLSNETIKKSIKNIFLEKKSEYVDYLPQNIRLKRNLSELNFSYEKIHFPNNLNELIIARHRLVYDELFLFNFATRYFKKKSNETGLIDLSNKNKNIVKTIIKNLGFQLTSGQINALNDIFVDFDNCKQLNRLIEGDVGCGKTIIAFLSMIYVATCNYQSVLMAPTDVLATQHYDNLKKLLDKNNLNINVCLLKSNLTKNNRKQIIEKIQDGSIDIIIGTHAVFSDDVIYKNLAYVITDEQHRFGVNQRKLLEDKSIIPNVVVMSATPIPRTLAMLLYADIDISIIKNKPKNRIEINNYVISESERNKAYDLIKKQIKLGHQCYIVCASIEKNENDAGYFSNLQNVTDYKKTISKIFNNDIRIEILHGKMKNDQKEKIMTDFKNNNIDILVSTTVIEVGVDCPNATVIMVEDAGCFGLSTLHQLRGRVGRGDSQSYAIFVDTTNTDNSKKRLDVLKKSNDGFYIANEDLKLRGPGDIFGIRQSGDMNFKIADLYNDSKILKEVVEDINELLENDKNLKLNENIQLKAKLDDYIKKGYTI